MKPIKVDHENTDLSLNQNTFLRKIQVGEYEELHTKGEEKDNKVFTVYLKFELKPPEITQESCPDNGCPPCPPVCP